MPSTWGKLRTRLGCPLVEQWNIPSQAKHQILDTKADEKAEPSNMNTAGRVRGKECYLRRNREGKGGKEAAEAKLSPFRLPEPEERESHRGRSPTNRHMRPSAPPFSSLLLLPQPPSPTRIARQSPHSYVDFFFSSSNPAERTELRTVDGTNDRPNGPIIWAAHGSIG